MKNRFEYEIVRSDRKTLAIQIKPDGRIVVRAPRRMEMRRIEGFIEEKSEWIERTLKRVIESNNARADISPLDESEIKALYDKAGLIIPIKVSYYAELLGVEYGRITIRNQKTLWGSCSGKRNLNFNCLLMLTPSEIIDYVVVHELCHLKEMNHSKAFWKEVEKVLPDYRERRRWLKENGKSIISLIPKRT